MESTDVVRALAALANSHRLTLFRALVIAGPSGLAAGSLAAAAGISPANLTFHLKELDHAGLTRSWRDGRFVRTALNVDAVRTLIAFMTEDCCGGRPELCGDGFVASDALCCGETKGAEI